MEDLPMIPGYTFQDCLNQDHKLKQKLIYSNGCRVICDGNIGTGRRPVDSTSSAYAQEQPEEVIYDPSLTYGRAKSYPYRQVIPHYVLYAQRCLNFKAFFRESVFNSPAEHFRIRHVNIIYYLEDDTMCVMEPPIDNAGFKQGRLVRRGKIPKNQDGQFYHWKELNVGIDIAIYGIVYHTVDCDTFTSEFLRSQGIDVGEREIPPPDSYIQDRLAKAAATKAALSACKKTRPGSEDARRRFLEFAGMVLTFEATWNDDFYQLMYFLTDDTIAIKEVSVNSGKNPARLLLKRMKVPKNWADLPSTFPSCYLERGDDEVVEYYTPMDLKIGDTVFIFGRRFLLYDCDAFTRKYYSSMLNITQPPRVDSGVAEPQRTPYKTISRGSLERSGDRPNKQDVIRQILHHNKKLRYLISMVANYPEDQGREFILEYGLGDGKIKICEIGRRNSGRRAGCFLASMLVPKGKPINDTNKNNSTDEEDTNRDYYTPEDFFIGAEINIFKHRFVIKGADLFVLKYLEENSAKFSPKLLDNIRNYFENNKTNASSCNVEQQEKQQTTTGDVTNKEPIYPSEKRSNSPVNAEKIIENLPKLEDCRVDDDESRGERPTSSRQITWADQVRVPCTL